MLIHVLVLNYLEENMKNKYIRIVLYPPVFIISLQFLLNSMFN